MVVAGAGHRCSGGALTSVSLHLVGGGWSPQYAPELYGEFLAEAAARAAGSGRMIPRIGVAALADAVAGADPASDGGVEHRYLDLFSDLAAHELVFTTVHAGERFPSSILSDIDGLMVGAGSTPDYFTALVGLSDEIRLLVADGLPYLGLGAGAALVSERAIVGGWMLDDIPVAPPEVGKGLEDVTVVDGFGLVDLTVEIHTAQWGTLGRLVAAVEAGIVPGGVAIDEDTVLIVGEELSVAGAARVWQVVDQTGYILVQTLEP